MIRWLRLNLQQAGLSQSRGVLAASVISVVLAFALIQDWLGVFWLSVAISMGVAGLLLETLASRARARARRIEEEWPTVIEALESAALAGISLPESLRDLAESSQLFSARDFAWLCDQCDSGVQLDHALEQLKAKFGLSSADLTIETLRLVNESGGAGFQNALALQARSIRQRTQMIEQVVAKQGWVIGTAKVAVAAPWLIVLLLCFRTENAIAYNTAMGQVLLALGLISSFIALRLVSIIGRIDVSQRVFA